MIATLGADGMLRWRDRMARAASGRSGIIERKREGDGATPAGLLPVRRILYRADRMSPPATRLSREPIAPNDGWCDEPASPDYNRQVTLPHDAHCEELWRRDGLYDVVAVLGWNDAPPSRGEGSAIFLHVATPDYAPTDGCVALSLADLLELLGAGLDGVAVEP